MRTFFLNSILMLLMASALEAQNFKPLADVGTLKQRLEQTAREVKSIEADFVQVKYLDVFDDEVSSKGRFYYRHENKICLDYSQPVSYLLVINGEKLKIVADGKKSVVQLKSNKVMKEMQGMLAGCMSGNLTQMADYKMDYFEDPSYYLVKIKPLNPSVQAYISGFDIYLDKKNLSVHRLRITEKGKDYTDYTFNHKKFNTLTTDARFAVN